tara:strand:- start:192 stop:401 length:210 start_codon:yes stop_codon:yes gene_type:complete
MTSDDFTPTTDKALALYALRELKVKKSEAFMSGDTIYDIKMGKNAEIKTVGITWSIIQKKNCIKQMRII